MGRMVRKQIVMDKARAKTLRRLSKELELSQSEIIRQAIDDFADRLEHADERNAAFKRLMHVAENAGDHGVVSEDGRLNWGREELHERISSG